MRHTIPALTCLCILAVLASPATASAQDPAPKLTGTQVKASGDALTFGGHVERLNAQLPSPWPGLRLQTHPAPKAWTFSGTYWEGVAQLCKQFDCNIAPGYDTVDFNIFQKDVAYLSPQGPLLFVLTNKVRTPQLYIFVEPRMGIVDVPSGRVLVNGKELDLSYGSGSVEGPLGDLSHGWRLELEPDMTGPLKVEVDVVFSTTAATLSLPPQKGAKASHEGISAVVEEATPNKLKIDVTGGPLLAFYTNHSALERATGGGSVSDTHIAWSYNVEQWPADTQIFLSVGTATTTQRFTAEFNGVDFKALTSQD